MYCHEQLSRNLFYVTLVAGVDHLITCGYQLGVAL